MKQLLSLLFFLLPCLAMAQYPGNGNQKITLGEQTSADGLVFRGVASIDTVTATSKITRANKQDTSAYLLLDTVTNLLWHYKTASNGWIQAGGGVSVSSFSGGTTGLTPSTATTGAVTLGGTLAVLNGGTNTGTLTANKVMVGNGTGGVLTPTNLHWDNTHSNLGIGTASPSEKLTIKGGDGNQLLLDNAGENFTQINFAQNGSAKSLLAVDHRTNFKGFLFANQISASDYRKISFRPDGSNDAVIMNNDEMWVGYTTDQGAYKLQVNSQIFATNATIETSDIRFKENIQPLDKGLEIINKLKPVKFNFISTTENNFSEFDEIGFIAQDVEGALSTELFAKAVVKKLDEDKDDSALGLMTEKLIPILVKAIQEQQALIKALEQRIINLENK
jgi:hypothetical protein